MPAQAARDAPDRGFWAGLAALLALHFALGLTALDAAPRFFDDEAWETSQAWALAHEGVLRNLSMTGCGGMELRFVQPRLVLPLGCASLYRVADLGIATCRITSLLANALAIVAFALFARRRFGTGLALGVGLLIVVHPWFFELGRRARPAAWVLGFTAVGLWRFAANLEARRGGALAGASLALAILAHPIGVLASAAVGGAALLVHGVREVFARLPRLVLGAVFVFAPYAAYAWLASQHPGVSFATQLEACGAVAPEHLSRYFTGFLDAWAFFFQWPWGAPLALSLAAGFAAVWRGGTRADRLVALTLALFLVFAPYWKAQIGRYLGAMAPFMAFLVARAVARLAAGDRALLDVSPRVSRICAAALAVCQLAPSIGGIGLVFQRLSGADPDALFARIGRTVGRDALVYGEMLFWLGHEHYRFSPTRKELEYGEIHEELASAGVDYVIRSGWRFPSSHALAAPPQRMPPPREISIDRVVARNGTLVDAFRDPHYGPIEIYRMDWSQDP